MVEKLKHPDRNTVKLSYTCIESGTILETVNYHFINGRYIPFHIEECRSRRVIQVFTHLVSGPYAQLLKVEFDENEERREDRIRLAHEEIARMITRQITNRTICHFTNGIPELHQLEEDWRLQ